MKLCRGTVAAPGDWFEDCKGGPRKPESARAVRKRQEFKIAAL